MNDDKPYSNREIDRMFGETHASVKNIEEKILPKILEQVIRTNGRVTKLEDKNIVLESKVSSGKTGVVVGWTLFILIIVPLLIYINHLQIEMSGKVIQAKEITK